MEFNEELKKMMAENAMALCTIDENGNPYAIGVAFVKIKDGKFVLTDSYMNQTLKNIQKNPNVSMVVWNKELEGYQINGKAEHFDSGKWYDFVKSLKENEEYPAKGAVVITVESIKKLA